MNKFAFALFASALTLPAAIAQDTAPAPSLALELNALQPVEAGCRVTILATNTLGSALTTRNHLAFPHRVHRRNEYPDEARSP